MTVIEFNLICRITEFLEGNRTGSQWLGVSSDLCKRVEICLHQYWLFDLQCWCPDPGKQPRSCHHQGWFRDQRGHQSLRPRPSDPSLDRHVNSYRNFKLRKLSTNKEWSVFVFSDLLDAGRVIIVSSILLKSVQKLNLNLLREFNQSAQFDGLVIFLG